MENNNNEVTFLYVPFAQKDNAKALGAKWNAVEKKWFVPAGLPVEPFALWVNAPAIPVKPEKKTLDLSRWVKVPEHEPRLYVDLVPSTAWYSNLRSELTREEWDLVRHTAYKVAGGKCEICGDVGFNQGRKHALEAHERWGYDLDKLTQTLIGVQALCPNCHEATHMGWARINDNEERAMAHLQKINGWDSYEANEHDRNAAADWIERGNYQWRLDMSWLLVYEDQLSQATVDKIKEAMASDGSERVNADVHPDINWESQSEYDPFVEGKTGSEMMIDVMKRTGII